jgi:hypothetical protein
MDLSLPAGPVTYEYGTEREAPLGRSVPSDRGSETSLPGAVVHAPTPIPIGKTPRNWPFDGTLGELVPRDLGTDKDSDGVEDVSSGELAPFPVDGVDLAGDVVGVGASVVVLPVSVIGRHRGVARRLRRLRTRCGGNTFSRACMEEDTELTRTKSRAMKNKVFDLLAAIVVP